MQCVLSNQEEYEMVNKLDKALATPSKFDVECRRFTDSLILASDWKNIYFGTAYSTRLRQAIVELKIAITRIEEVLDNDN